MMAGTLYGQTTFPKIRGWNLADSAKRYDQETLWEYIDGAAESFLNYDFRFLEVMEYHRTSDEYIKAEIYHQGSGLQAFGIYAFERPEVAEFLDLGCEGYMIYSSLNFYVKDCYVKILSHQEDEKTLEAIRIIADKLSQSIEKEPEKPALLDLLPDYEKIPRSEKYFPSNYLGYSFLNHVITAEYLNNDNRYSLFILLADDQEEALKSLYSYLKQTKTEKEPLTGEIYRVEDIFNGLVVLTVADRYLLGILGMEDADLATEFLSQFVEYATQTLPR
jgi:hypothetical protein